MQIGQIKKRLRKLGAIAFAVTALSVAALSLPGAAHAQETAEDGNSATSGESQTATVYTSQVERWRDLVTQYFAPEDVDKALYVIQLESGGNPSAVNRTSGAAGLFQIMPFHSVNGQDPETAVSWAANQVYNVRGGWQDWGEGALYRGQAFGALGVYPYSGASTSDTTAVTESTWTDEPAEDEEPADTNTADRRYDGDDERCQRGPSGARSFGPTS